MHPPPSTPIHLHPAPPTSNQQFHSPPSTLDHLQCYKNQSIKTLTLTMCELHHWASIASMLSQSHCVDEEDGHIALSS